MCSIRNLRKNKLRAVFMLLTTCMATQAVAGFYDGDAPNTVQEERQPESRPQLDGMTQRLLDQKAELRQRREAQLRDAGKDKLMEKRDQFESENAWVTRQAGPLNGRHLF